MRRDAPDLYAALLDAIDQGVYPPGARLVETELAARFGVSRTPVREALGRLESQGIAAADGGRGLRVATLDAGQLSELYDLRAVMEGFAARLAARRASNPEIAAICAMVEADRARLAAGESLTVSNRRFHSQIHRASHNRYLNQSLNVMRRSLVLLSGTTLAEADRAEASIEEHAAIARAMRARDEDAAEAAARAHIVNAYAARLRIDSEKDS